MNQGWLRLVTAVVFVAATASTALGQASSTASISGVVVDADGGVIPGADVIVKNTKTGETFTTVSSDRGVFAVPALITGTYTRDGVARRDSRPVDPEQRRWSTPACRPTCARRSKSAASPKQVTVQANSELVQTQSATVATTLDTRRSRACRWRAATRRSSSCSCRASPTPGGTRDSIVNGLPQSTINMTLDGVNIQDNTLKTHRRLLRHRRPAHRRDRGDHGHTAAGGAEALGSGRDADSLHDAVGHQPVLRGRRFHQYRSDTLNTNTWFNKRDNLPKPELLLNQPGFNVGGPIRLPGFDGRNKAFFFVNYEELRQPCRSAAQPPAVPPRCDERACSDTAPPAAACRR